MELYFQSNENGANNTHPKLYYGTHPMLWNKAVKSETGVLQGDPLDPLCFAPVLNKPVSIVDANGIKGQWLELDTSSWTPSVLCTDSHLVSLGTHITTCNVQYDAFIQYVTTV